jgi:hypothetical protein
MATPTTLPATFVAGNVLTAAQQNALRGAFRILQVVDFATTTTATTTSTSYVTSNVTASITPSSTTSKIIIIAAMSLSKTTAGSFSEAFMKAFRGTVAGTAVANSETRMFTPYETIALQTMVCIDSPATVSATTYTIGIKTISGSITVEAQRGSYASNLYLLEVSA